MQESSLRWIFDPNHEDSQCELPLSSVNPAGYVRNHVVDRSFVDAEGARWIIDYKSGKPGSNKSEIEFIDEQISHHRDQLAQYADLFAAMETRPIRMALLFTALPRLVEID